ncbi:MAG: site-2 protease family protein [Planctomycetota bacterium]
MILAEPPPSQGDLHFRLFGFPVRIHPFFWVVAVLLSIRGDSPPEKVLSWVVALLVSILIHELGHALLQRRYGGSPRIVLHGMGGLAICSDCDRSSRSQILISLAGPVAGFVFAAVVLVLINLMGYRAGISLSRPDITGYAMPLLGMSFYWEAFESMSVNEMVGNLLRINVLWGAVNLLPIYPLDGGQISRELCQQRSPREGIVLSLQISMIAAIAMAIVGLSWGELYIVVLFGYLAYSSYKTLEAYRGSAW